MLVRTSQICQPDSLLLLLLFSKTFVFATQIDVCLFLLSRFGLGRTVPAVIRFQVQTAQEFIERWRIATLIRRRFLICYGLSDKFLQGHPFNR